MQQRRFLGGCAEIAALPREIDIAREQCGRQRARAQSPVVERQQDQPAHQDRKGDHDEQCRKDTTYAPYVETGQGKAPFGQVMADDRRDQIA